MDWGLQIGEFTNMGPTNNKDQLCVCTYVFMVCTYSIYRHIYLNVVPRKAGPPQLPSLVPQALQGVHTAHTVSTWPKLSLGTIHFLQVRDKVSPT